MDFADTDSEDELPHGWEVRVTPEGWIYYAKSVHKMGIRLRNIRMKIL